MLQLLLILWLVALALLLLRMLQLGLHHPYLLFAISTGLSLVFGVATLQAGINSHVTENLGMLADTMDIFLAPSIAMELFALPKQLGTPVGRSLMPVYLMIIAGSGVVMFLSSSPDAESVQSAYTLAYMADTMVTILVLSFVMRKNREKQIVERNTLWLRRLFTMELVISATQSLIALFIKPSQFSFFAMAFFGVSMIATAVCTFGLRREPSVPAKA